MEKEKTNLFLTTPSQEQSRRGFSRYLRLVQQRLPGLENSTDGEHQLDLIERFLQRLGSAGRLRSASPSVNKVRNKVPIMRNVSIACRKCYCTLSIESNQETNRKWSRG